VRFHVGSTHCGPFLLDQVNHSAFGTRPPRAGSMHQHTIISEAYKENFKAFDLSQDECLTHVSPADQSGANPCTKKNPPIAFGLIRECRSASLWFERSLRRNPQLCSVCRHPSTCLCMGSKFRCMRSTPTEIASTSENFGCLARPGVNTPGTMSPNLWTVDETSYNPYPRFRQRADHDALRLV
jgi:hypothetical protein